MTIFNIVPVVFQCVTIFNIVPVVFQCVTIFNIVPVVFQCVTIFNIVPVVFQCVTIFNIVPVVFQCVTLVSMDGTVPLNAAVDVIKPVTIKMGHAPPVRQAGQEANVKVSIKISRYPLTCQGIH